MADLSSEHITPFCRILRFHSNIGSHTITQVNISVISDQTARCLSVKFMSFVRFEGFVEVRILVFIPGPAYIMKIAVLFDMTMWSLADR